MLSQSTNNNYRRKRSMRLAGTEQKAFKRYAQNFDTYTDMQEATGINRAILSRINNGGTFRYTTYEKLRTLNIIPAA